MDQLRRFAFHPEKLLSEEDILSTYDQADESARNSLWYKHSRNIAELRLAAQRANGRRICVFCMPKSGSSFVATTLAKTFNVSYPTLAVTSLQSSQIGCNPREQELDELAIIYSNIFFRSYVSQMHTRASPYLATLLSNYGIQPFVTFRSIPDCIVSFDNMMIEWLSSSVTKGVWHNTGGRLTLSYSSMSAEDRLALMIDTWGKWYVEFYVSWKRLEAHHPYIRPVTIWYEQDILNGSAGLVNKINTRYRLNDQQKERMLLHCSNPDRTKSRLNKGVSGRGMTIGTRNLEKISQLVEYYGDEISSEEAQKLLGYT